MQTRSYSVLDKLDSAIRLLKADKPPFPLCWTSEGVCVRHGPRCEHPGKQPLVRGRAYQEHLPTEQEVTDWWTQWPHANIGMATGQISAIMVVDCDSAGATNRFEDNYPEAEDTLQVQTARGKHYYFQFEEGIRNDAGKLLGPGIDVRGEGGFVIIPPSIHASGKPYQWLNRSKPSPLSTSLREVLVSRNKVGPFDGSVAESFQERFDTAKALAGVPEGQRDETLFKLAGKLRNADVPQEMAEKLVLEAAQNCQPSFSESIALEKVGRVYERYQTGTAPSDPKVVSALGEETVRKDIKLQTWEEFLSTTPEEREYTINGILPDSGLAVLLGRGKHGKSTLVTHACRAIASGQGFLDRGTKVKPVVYVNYEMAEDYLQTLLRAGDCPTGAYIINRPEPILTLKAIENIMGQVENGPGMMVIDSFRGAFKLQGEAENLSGGAGVLLRQLQDLAINKGWLIILIHHSNRGSREGTDSVSGTSDWIAAPDVLWSWSRPDPDKSGTLIIEGRIPPLDPMAVQLSLESCEYVGTVKEDQEKADKGAIQGFLTEDWQITKDIVALTGLAEGTIRTRLNSLHKDGLVERDGKGVSKNPFKWREIVSAQDNPLSAETNNGDNQAEEGAQCQTFNL